MAIKTRLGRLKGTTDSLQLGITVWDDSGDTLNADDAYAAALLIAPANLFGELYPTGAPTIDEQSRNIHKFSITYEPPEANQPEPPPPPELGTKTRRANCQAKSKTLFNFLEPIGVVDAEGDATSKYSHTKWKIDLSRDGDQYYSQSHGTNFDPLPETRTLDYYAPNATITDAYLDTIEDLVCRGCFNSLDYFGKPAGSLQLVRFSLSERSTDDWELSFGFGYKPPTFNVPVGPDITIPEMRGSWYYWTRDKHIFNDTARIVEVKAAAAFVGRVWDEADFTALALPA